MTLLHRVARSSPRLLTIAPMQRRDVAEVARVERATYPAPWSAEVFRGEVARMSRGDGEYLVVRRGTDLVGYGGVMYMLDEAHVTNLVVVGSERRSGLGTRLLAELCWRTIAHGSSGLTLEVRASNEAAQALYGRFGFERVGVRRRYYENTEDAIVMWCRDIASGEYADRLRALCPEAAR